MDEHDLDTLLLRHFALEMAFHELLAGGASADMLETKAASFREMAASARAKNRAGLGVTRASLYGMNAPMLDVAAELYEAAAASARDKASAPPAATSALDAEPVVDMAVDDSAAASNVTPFPRSVATARPT